MTKNKSEKINSEYENVRKEVYNRNMSASYNTIVKFSVAVTIPTVSMFFIIFYYIEKSKDIWGVLNSFAINILSVYIAYFILDKLIKAYEIENKKMLQIMMKGHEQLEDYKKLLEQYENVIKEKD